MTETLLKKIEEKIIALLTELEVVRTELAQVRQENTILKVEQANSTQKLRELIALLDALDTPTNQAYIANEQDILQGQREYVNA